MGFLNPNGGCYYCDGDHFSFQCLVPCAFFKCEEGNHRCGLSAEDNQWKNEHLHLSNHEKTGEEKVDE